MVNRDSKWRDRATYVRSEESYDWREQRSAWRKHSDLRTIATNEGPSMITQEELWSLLLEVDVISK